MARYIDADKVMEEINRIGGHNLCEWETIGVKALIDRQPTADVVEVKHGEWKIKNDEFDCEYMMCSCCKEEFYPVDADTVDTTPNYCPNCGAEMKERENR